MVSKSFDNICSHNYTLLTSSFYSLTHYCERPEKKYIKKKRKNRVIFLRHNAVVTEKHTGTLATQQTVYYTNYFVWSLVLKNMTRSISANKRLKGRIV